MSAWKVLLLISASLVFGIGSYVYSLNEKIERYDWLLANACSSLNSLKPTYPLLDERSLTREWTGAPELAPVYDTVCRRIPQPIISSMTGEIVKYGP